MTTPVTPRRPVFFSADQMENLVVSEDPRESREIAVLTAQALFSDAPICSHYQLPVRQLLEAGGIDQIGELWSESPANSLPGVLWRLFLIQQWYQRYPQLVAERFTAGLRLAQPQPVATEMLLHSAQQQLDKLNQLLVALWCGHLPISFPSLLNQVKQYLLILGQGLDGSWITDRHDDLADPVTLRGQALRKTAFELAVAADLAARGRLC